MNDQKGDRTTDAPLIDVLRTKRWFGEKGRDVRAVRLRDTTPIDWPGSRRGFAVARVEVTTDSGASTYQLFAPRNERGDVQPAAEALDDPDFLRGFADAWVKGAEFGGDATRWIVEREGRTPLVVPPNAPIARTQAEQTNSSIVLNREAILKLYRRIEPGIHPDVEVTRFLTLDRQFVHVPVLLGTVRFEDADGTTIAGMLQEYVEGATDAWAFALESLRAAKEGAPAPFENDAAQLGEVTRALHEHLASGDRDSDFDLRPATRADIEGWVNSARRTITGALEALERALSARTIRGPEADEAKAIARARSGIMTGVDSLADGIAADAGANTRTHGDLHLGQVLRSATARYLVIDFEGEPTRPLRERRARNSPLRDVAGMLRSFAYAAATVDRGDAGSRWEQTARSAFLGAYFGAATQRPGLLPKSRANADRLLRLFETEKAFYELQYELAHRPDWVWIPIRGIMGWLA